MPLFPGLELSTRCRKRPFGSNSGRPCCNSPSDTSRVVKGAGDPPEGETCIKPRKDPNRIRPSGVHTAGRNGSWLQMATGAPPPKSSRHNLESAAHPIDLPSGDQNGNLAVALSVNNRSAAPSSGWSHSACLPARSDEYVTYRPSGETERPQGAGRAPLDGTIWKWMTRSSR